MAERRKNKRFPLDKDYYFYPANRSKVYTCKVRNVSASGACIISKKNLTPHDIIFLHITGTRGAQFKSEVIWAQDGLYGLSFLLENSEDFDNISYVMNMISKKINAPS